MLAFRDRAVRRGETPLPRTLGALLKALARTAVPAEIEVYRECFLAGWAKLAPERALGPWDDLDDDLLDAIQDACGTHVDDADALLDNLNPPWLGADDGFDGDGTKLPADVRAARARRGKALDANKAPKTPFLAAPLDTLVAGICGPLAA